MEVSRRGALLGAASVAALAGLLEEATAAITASTINYQFVSVCAGGAHVTLDISLKGAAAKRIVYLTDEVRAPLSALTADEQAQLALLILKVHMAGATRSEIQSALTSSGGVTVTI